MQCRFYGNAAHILSKVRNEAPPSTHNYNIYTRHKNNNNGDNNNINNTSSNHNTKDTKNVYDAILYTYKDSHSKL